MVTVVGSTYRLRTNGSSLGHMYAIMACIMSLDVTSWASSLPNAVPDSLPLLPI